MASLFFLRLVSRSCVAPPAAICLALARVVLAGQVIGELGVEMDARFAHIRTRETNCSNWVADCILDGLLQHNAKVPVDCVIVNSGTLRADENMARGEFKMKHLVTLLPMLDEMSVLQLSGAQLLEALENGVCMYPKLEGRFPCVSGIRFQFDGQRPAGSRVLQGSVTLRGEPLDLEASYNVATKAYLALGRDGYSVFAQGKVLLDGETLPMLPDLLRTHLNAISELNASVETLPDGTRRLRNEEQMYRTPSRAASQAQAHKSTPDQDSSTGSPLNLSHANGNAPLSRSPSSVMAARNRRRQSVARLASNIHVASIEEGAEQEQASEGGAGDEALGGGEGEGEGEGQGQGGPTATGARNARNGTSRELEEVTSLSPPLALSLSLSVSASLR